MNRVRVSQRRNLAYKGSLLKSVTDVSTLEQIVNELYTLRVKMVINPKFLNNMTLQC